MGFDKDNGHNNNRFKLSLYSLPNQEPEPEGWPTPPLRTLASVPFEWEEAPGKPRSPADSSTVGLPPKPKAMRSLELPPRLAKITKTPSPTTVLDGPYTNRKLPRAMSFSFGRRAVPSFRGGEKRHVDEEKIIRKCDERGFSSWRWGSLEESSGEWRGISDFSYSIGGRATRSESEFSTGKIGKFRKRGSFFGSSKFQTWTNIYESVKHAVHWRRKR